MTGRNINKEAEGISFTEMISGKGRYKRRCLWSIVGIVVVLFIAYQFAFKRTIQVYYDNMLLKSQVRMIQNAPQKLRSLRNENSYYDGFIVEQDSLKTNKRNDLLAITSSFCSDHTISIREMPVPLHERINEFMIENNRFTLQGDFKNLMKYLNYLESKENIGALRSVRFYAQKQAQTKAKELLLDVYIQNLVNTN